MDISSLKPILKKIVPPGVLRMGKEQMLRSVQQRMCAGKVEGYNPGKFPSGVNLIGPLYGDGGLGQSFRLVERALRETGIPYIIRNFDSKAADQDAWKEYDERVSDDLKYGINIWHVNPKDFAECYITMRKESFNGHYNIAFWLWELEDFPDEWVPYIALLDEIWTPSEFISEAIRKKTDKPVYTIPYHASADADTDKYDRKYFGLPKDQFLFLMMYDALSLSERKNPNGAIKAFKEAFPADAGNVGLVIKAGSAGKKDLQELRERTSEYKNCYIFDRTMSKTEVNSLIADCDVYVSLHRAEGFGLVMAEAMLLGTPVIATNWSGNTEFMNNDVACMVDYKLKKITQDIYPYKKGGRWADPDIHQAAEHMTRLAGDAAFRRELAGKAHAYIEQKLSLGSAAERIEERIIGNLGLKV